MSCTHRCVDARVITDCETLFQTGYAHISTQEAPVGVFSLNINQADYFKRGISRLRSVIITGAAVCG